MSFISSNQNRVYAAAEPSYGVAPSVEQLTRLPLVRLSARRRTELPKRLDKTGTRTFAGIPQGSRKHTRVELRTHLSQWAAQVQEPSYGCLFRSALGGAVQSFGGGVVIGTSSSGMRIQFQSPHNLTPGQGLSIGNQIRFTTTVPDPHSVDINAPFSVTPPPGAQASRTITYRLGSLTSSVCLLDCWSPSGAVQRAIAGFAVDEFTVEINSDFHEFQFSGPAHDLVDNLTFQEGQSGFVSFPEEPTGEHETPSLVPGHLGEAIIGNLTSSMVHLTKARVQMRNNLDVTPREFGAERLRDVIAGLREVVTDFEVCAAADEGHNELYSALKQGDGFPLMMQLGQRTGELFGVYLPSVVGDTPTFEDSDTRLRWRVQSCRAQGSADDEMVVAFA